MCPKFAVNMPLTSRSPRRQLRLNPHSAKRPSFTFWPALRWVVQGFLQLPPRLPPLIRGRISYTRPLEFLRNTLRQWQKRHRYHGNVSLDPVLNGHASDPESRLDQWFTPRCAQSSCHARYNMTSPSPEPQWRPPILHHFLVNPQRRRRSAQVNRVGRFAKLGNLYLGCLKVLRMHQSLEAVESLPPRDTENTEVPDHPIARRQ